MLVLVVSSVAVITLRLSSCGSALLHGDCFGTLGLCLILPLPCACLSTVGHGGYG